MNKFIKKAEAIMEFGGAKKEVVFLILSGFSLVISIFDLVPLPFDIAWVAIILCGLPIITEAIIGLVTSFDIRAGVLVSLALIASICIGEVFAAGEIAFIMQLGELLEDMTVAKARAGIEKLIHLTPQSARVILDGIEYVIPAKDVKVGDIIRVLPGEAVAVDGIIISGQTSVNQAVMTGESLPVDKTVGDEVSSGTVNQFGAFEMRATKVGEDSSIQRMIKLIQSADAGKAKIVGIADKWATWIVIIALTVAGLTWAFTGEVIRAVTILVVFCPCALVLATPTAIMAAIGNATRHGFLVREGDALERLAKVSKITFDKTGTLTYGTPEVTAVKSVSEYSEDEIYSLVASAEQMSEHPLGKAIVRCYGKSITACRDFKMTLGEGVTAVVDGKVIKAGNLKLLKEVHISQEVADSVKSYLDKGGTVIYVAIDDILAGYIVLSDIIRKESKGMIAELRKIGIEPVLLTGDNKNTADAIAGQLGIIEVKANCLPEDKLNYISAYQQDNNAVCMIGDGINDAPALKKANVGIALGGVGSDIAVDASDIALVDDEIKELPHLLSLSKKMMTTIKINLAFSMVLNFLAIVLAVTARLDPVSGAIVHNAGSILVIINSVLLLNWREK